MMGLHRKKICKVNTQHKTIILLFFKNKPGHIPGIDDLAFHDVVVVDAFHLGVDWFSRVMVQSHNQSTIMLVLSETSDITTLVSFEKEEVATNICNKTTELLANCQIE
jgi:hypothetical protein